MSEHAVAPEFELPNVGPGPDQCSLAGLAADNDFLVLYFHRDHRCSRCRKQAMDVAERFESFRSRNALPVSILPETREEAERWQDKYDLPYPLLVDPWTDTTDAYDQPVRFGFIGDVSDYFGRMPHVVVVDARGPESRIVWSHSGRSTFDRPSSREVLAAVDEHRES